MLVYFTASANGLCPGAHNLGALSPRACYCAVAMVNIICLISKYNDIKDPSPLPFNYAKR